MNVTRLAQDIQLGSLAEIGEAEGFGSTRRLQLELIKGDFAKPGAALYGSFLLTELIGIGGLTPDPYPDAGPDTGRLRHLYVLPQYRRQSIGQTLVAAILQEAARHYRVLRLRTMTPKAARFYGALGFTAVTEPCATHTLKLR